MDKRMLRYFFAIIAVVIIIFILFTMLAFYSLRKPSKTGVAKDSIESIIKNFGGEYLAKVTVEYDDEYPEQHLVKFNKPLIDVDGNSNRDAYDNLIKEVARVLNYRNTELVDEDADITINIICSAGQISTILINGVENYFDVLEAQLATRNYSNIIQSNIEVQAVELSNLLRNNWSTNFGEEESEFQRFKEYSSRGFKVKYLNNNFYNIVFTENYDDYVVNNIKPSDDIARARAVFGNPTFKNENETMIGYKGDGLYVFFSEGEISVYRDYKYDDYSGFIDLVDQYVNDEISINTFYSKITELWPDYNQYEYKEDGFYISYPTRGIAIKWNYDDLKHFIIYNNSGFNDNQIAKLGEYAKVLLQRSIDAYDIAEQERVAEKENLDNEFKKFIDTYGTDENYLVNPNYDLYVKKDLNGFISALYAVSKDKSIPDRQLITGVRSFAWYNDTILLYGIPESGIYFYNLKNGYRGPLISGDSGANYTIKSCNNGILKYDNEEVQVIL